jgi:amino acid permease
MASHINQDHEVSAARWNDSEQGKKDFAEVDMRGVSPSEHNVATETLARKLSARQVQMIAIGGECTITYFLAIHSRPALTMEQVQSVLVCSWERERVLPRVVLHLC